MDDDWHDMDDAPLDRPIWLRIGKWERIAKYDGRKEYAPFHWNFDSQQVNFWLYNGRGRGNYPTRWRELAHASENDPANLGKKPR